MKIILIAALAALLAGAGGAYAGTSQIFGDGGKTYQFDAMCHRVTFVPPGILDHEAINVLGQQVYCLVRRPDPFAKCVKKLGPAPAVTLWRKDDWKGVKQLRNYVANISNCSHAHL